jgi:hypothetical protein
MPRITVGHDGEVFLRHPETRQFVSAIGKIGGTKDAPIPIPHLGQGYALQEDNVTVEFNVPAATTSAAFVASISAALGEVHRRAAEMGLEVSIYGSALFSDEELSNPLARIAGCSVDYNAWTMEENPRPDFSKTNLRTSGGHVHIGTTAKPYAVIRACDYFLGVPSVILDPDTARRKIYGSAGAFRFTPWGVEYRTLSNFWLRSPELVEWVFEATQKAVNEASKGSTGPNFMLHLRHDIEGIIQSGDVDKARRFCDSAGIHYPR